jgi:hypothetical protein
MPKLTLRDLFAVVTIVALALGWAVDHWRQSEANFRLRLRAESVEERFAEMFLEDMAE